ncbi:MAG: hypothetical protein QXH21_07250 [Ignisphaera sp.]
MPELSNSNTTDAKKTAKARRSRVAKKRKVDTGRVKACWRVDPKYMIHRPEQRLSQDLYLCITDMFRIVMLDKPIVPFFGYVPDGNDLLDIPVDYAKYPFRFTCRLPVPSAVYKLRDFLSWVKTPCYMYYPCTCYCTHHSTNYHYSYPCPRDACRESGCGGCYSSDEIGCTPVPLWMGVTKLMYTKIKDISLTYRYLVTVGTNTAYVAPLPPPKSLTYLFDYGIVKGFIYKEIHNYILDKYGGVVPNLLDLLVDGIYIDQSYVFPDGVPPPIRVEGKYISVDFNPRVVSFNYYTISRYRAHAVLIAWFDSNAQAYVVAKAAWEMKRDITNTLIKTFGPYIVKEVEEIFVNDAPVIGADVVQPYRWTLDNGNEVDDWGGEDTV